MKVILGNDCDGILEMQYCKFGVHDPKSVYIQSSAGIILSGRADHMIENLSALPGAEEVNPSMTNHVPFIGLNGTESRDDFGDETGEQISPNVPKTYFNPEYLLHPSESTGNFYSVDLQKLYAHTVNLKEDEGEGADSELNLKIIKYVLQNTVKSSSGRLKMPLTWNNNNRHLLGMNFNLSWKILRSSLRKLMTDKTKLMMYDEVFREQSKMGIIERITNLEAFKKANPGCSFLPHMGIFRTDRDTTKCRVVFLSNLCEKNGKKSLISHNQAILPGPCLNSKITTSLIMLRFDKFVLTFDVKKAFLNIELSKEDQNKLLFLWFKNIQKGDYSIIGFRNLRLSFGLRCSPTILMLALYRMLILDESPNEKLEKLKKSIYNLIYVDNGAYTCNDLTDMKYAYEMSKKVFSGYKFESQQFCCNEAGLQVEMDTKESTETLEEVKIFGMKWERIKDCIKPSKILLNNKAKTKRQVLQTINEIYDIFNLYGPFLLRAKLFLQKLSTDKQLSWDTQLNNNLLTEWKNIAVQANQTPQIAIPRFIGERNSTYSIVAFTDASREALGVVVYLKDEKTGKISFLTAKNRLLSENMRKKTIPALELEAVSLGTSFIHEVRHSISGETVVLPIDIKRLILFTDSMVCMHWVSQYSYSFGKMQKHPVFILNRLKKIEDECKKFPVIFSHIAGEENPSDHMTRARSFKVLKKTNFYEGPSFMQDKLDEWIAKEAIRVPNIHTCPGNELPALNTELKSNTVGRSDVSHLIPIGKYSRFSTLVNVQKYVRKFAGLLLLKIGKIHGMPDVYKNAIDSLISIEQRIQFPKVYDYLQSNSKWKRDVPEMITRFNLFVDENQVIRVKSKFKTPDLMPILLPDKSELTQMIIKDTHEKMMHSGVYCVLRELRKNFWITKYYSAVRRVLQRCIACKRFNENPVRLNQNAYRDFRVHPDNTPFSSVFLDYIGPFEVKLNGTRQKVWLLIICCLWSRAVNLKICLSANVDQFLIAIQKHVFEFGIFRSCVSDLGSNLQAGANIIKSFLSDPDTTDYLREHGTKKISFDHYCKGSSSLGSLVEVLVKQVKQLLYKSIRNNILSYFDFEFMVLKCTSLVNKRPVAFKDGLRCLSNEDIPIAITPEVLLRGYDTCAIGVIPSLQIVEDEEYNPQQDLEVINTASRQLSKVRERLVDLYNTEFLANLTYQAVDKKGRYDPVKHQPLKVGDIVLLYDKFTKRYNFPLGRVVDVDVNDLGEVTAARVLKGKTKEIVYRHVTSLILLIPGNDGGIYGNRKLNDTEVRQRKRLKRDAAVRCTKKLADHYKSQA